MNENRIKYQVLRYRPETDDAPHFETYDVPWRHETSVLDGLNYIRDNICPDLSYRSSCRMAICGSCAMIINSEPRLACKTFIRDYAKVGEIRIEPLENFPIERDLVTDISDMLEKCERIHPYIVPKEGAKEETEHVAGRQTPQEMERYRQFSQCIQCGCCYAACPQYKLNPSFIGPAALTMLYRFNHDSRDHHSEVRTAMMSQEEGVWSCTSVGYCTEVCPKLVDPAAAIQLGKEESAVDFLKHLIKRKK